MELENDDIVDEMTFVGDAADNTPKEIASPDPVFDMAFHPTAPFLAIGQVSGAVCIHEFRKNDTRYLSRLQLHAGGITGMEFSEDGEHLVTVSSDRSINILNCSAQKSILTIPAGKGNPHKMGISSVNICTDTIIATGDDDGKICLWDIRTRKVAMRYHEHGDYVSQMLFFSEVDQVVSASGDTCLGVYDMRAGAIIDYSEKRKDEINTIAFIPETCDIIAGTPAGSLPVWRYGSWVRPYDVFDNHPREVECIVTYNDNIVLTGACDGLVRVLQMHPVKRNLCQIGRETRRREGISKLRISHDRSLLACSGNDHIVTFVSLDFLANDTELDKLRSKAEQRHLNTLREATAETEAEKRREEAAEDSDWTQDSDDDAAVEGDDNGSSSGGSSDSSEGEEDSSSEEEVAPKKSDRQVKRERAAAAKWLKEEKKKKVNFQFERRKRRVQGFWGDLKN